MRTLVFILALATSPIGAAVCEVSCADHAVAGHHQASAPQVAVEVAPEVSAAEHHHHAEIAAEPQPSVPTSKVNSAIEDCSPLSGQPATMRVAMTGSLLASASAPETSVAYAIDGVHSDAGGPPLWSSPPPPSRSTITLRI